MLSLLRYLILRYFAQVVRACLARGIMDRPRGVFKLLFSPPRYEGYTTRQMALVKGFSPVRDGGLSPTLDNDTRTGLVAGICNYGGKKCLERLLVGIVKDGFLEN